MARHPKEPVRSLAEASGLVRARNPEGTVCAWREPRRSTPSSKPAGGSRDAAVAVARAWTSLRSFAVFGNPTDRENPAPKKYVSHLRFGARATHWQLSSARDGA